MRRTGRFVVLAATAVLGATVAVPALPARAAAAPVCTIGDKRLVEISGLSAAGKGYVAVNDGSDDSARRRIFYLTPRCSVSRTVKYPSRPRDTEDLAVAPDGTLWVADIGDNGKSRETVGLWRLPRGATKPALRRFTYPDGPHDAEALLLNGDGTPIIVTKDPFTAGLYVPVDGTGVLRRAGSFRIPGTSTSNPFGLPGRVVVTGGATAPDGAKVALRTYADAFEFAVTDGDVIAAVTDGEAVPTALPDEPQGESLAYSADGASLLTVSEATGEQAGTKPEIRRYASRLPAAKPSPSPPAPSRPAATATAAPPLAEPRRTSSSTELTAAGIGVAGVLALAALALVLIRRRAGR